MRARRALAGGTSALALGAVLAACGGSSATHTPDLSRLPLAPGARVVAQVHKCDPGAGAYCAVQLVVLGPGYRSSDEFLLSERRALHARGWTGATGDTGEESAADSPGHKLHLTYATAAGELDGLDLGWISRARPITLALSKAMFDRTPALSMMLELGPA